MALKITSPLYSSTAKGKIKGLGTFRQNKTGGYHLYTKGSRAKKPRSPFPAVNVHLAAAKRLHAQGAKVEITVYGHKRRVLIEPWGTFWNQYIFDHNVFDDQIHLDFSEDIPVALAAIGAYIDREASASALPVNASINAQAQQQVSEAHAVSISAGAVISSNAHFQNKPP